MSGDISIRIVLSSFVSGDPSIKQWHLFTVEHTFILVVIQGDTLKQKAMKWMHVKYPMDIFPHGIILLQWTVTYLIYLASIF
jgi:hypothetical protein